MLDPDAIEKRIQAALSQAGKDRTVARIAKEIGIPAQALYDYGSKGFLGKDSKKSLVEWLAKNGYLAEDSTKDPLAHDLAEELRALAKMLDSDSLQPEAKAIRFRDAILSYHKTLEHYATALKKIGQN